jgi:hypothetical protein
MYFLHARTHTRTHVFMLSCMQVYVGGPRGSRDSRDQSPVNLALNIREAKKRDTGYALVCSCSCMYVLLMAFDMLRRQGRI